MEALRWFQAVADGMTVTEVSEIDRVSQSGVSRALARLEYEVGAPLLRRYGRTLRMSEAGAAFKRHVDAVIHELDDGVAAVQQVIDPDSGSVTLAFESWLGSRWVPLLISEFHARYPKVRFEFVTQRAETTVSVRDRRDVDVEMTTLRPAPSAFGWHSIAREQLHLAVPATHPLACLPTVELKNLTRTSFVALRSGTALRRAVDDICAEAGMSPRIDFECDDLSTVLGFVACGMGVAITPLPHKDRQDPGNEDAAVRYLEISDASGPLDIGITWSLHRRLLPAAHAFLTHIREANQD